MAAVGGMLRQMGTCGMDSARGFDGRNARIDQDDAADIGRR